MPTSSVHNQVRPQGLRSKFFQHLATGLRSHPLVLTKTNRKEPYSLAILSGDSIQSKMNRPVPLEEEALHALGSHEVRGSSDQRKSSSSLLTGVRH